MTERYGDAIETFRRSVALNPEGALYARIYLAACYGLLGNIDAAREEMDEVRRKLPEFSKTWVRTFLPYKRAADIDRLLEGLRLAGLAE